ncbi:MAG TPA: dipeptide ABC transporter permease DppC, partial [Anaerolineae bacterium]|nr:dipeptide ABC transporter permease DppC [Anaerolineae bacterium]
MSEVSNAIRLGSLTREAQVRSRPRLRLGGFRQNVPVILGALIIATVIASALLADVISPHDPTTQQISQRLLPPSFLPGGSSEYWLGTDQLGRDTLSRIIYGARVSLTI